MATRRSKRIDIAQRAAMSLLEVTAALTLIAIVAAVTVPALKRPSRVTTQTACELQRKRLDAEAWVFRRQNGRWPDDMVELTQDLKRFPNGALVCPVSGEGYEWSEVSESVLEHDHDE